MNAKERIEQHLGSLPGWQRENLVMFRRLVHEVEPAIEEDWKWSVPVFLFKGKLVLAMSTFKEHTKFNFFVGARMKDPDGLFNSGLDSKQHRSINMKQGDKIDPDKLKKLIQEALKVSQE
jgi:hypothetical protein